jgi:hypothetical protein
LISFAPAGGAAAVADAPLLPPSSAASTSSLPIRPAGPLPATAARSIPCAAAIRRATGVTREPSGTPMLAPLPSPAGRGAASGSGAAGRAERTAPAPAVMRPIT